MLTLFAHPLRFRVGGPRGPHSDSGDRAPGCCCVHRGCGQETGAAEAQSQTKGILPSIHQFLESKHTHTHTHTLQWLACQHSYFRSVPPKTAGSFHSCFWLAGREVMLFLYILNFKTSVCGVFVFSWYLGSLRTSVLLCLFFCGYIFSVLYITNLRFWSLVSSELEMIVWFLVCWAVFFSIIQYHEVSF